MKAISKLPWKTIGTVSLYVFMGLLSAFFLVALYQSNLYFFSFITYDAVIPQQGLELSRHIFIAVITLAVVALSVISIVMRHKKTVNKILLGAAAGLSLLSMIFFMVMAQLSGRFEIGFQNANLYAVYFLISLFSAALPLFSAILNLIKIKRAPVTFAKTQSTAAAEKEQKQEDTQA